LSTQLPSITVTDTFVVANQAAMLDIIGETGDVAVRTDLNKSFILKGTNPSVLGDWQELLTPTDAVQSFNGRAGTIVPIVGDYTADQITETATNVFQTPTQRTNNDATSSIQTQLNSKALDSSVVHLSGTETISGNKVFTGALNRFDNQLLVNQLLLKKLGLTEYNQIGAYNGRMEFLQNSGTQFSFNMATDYFDFGLINKVAKVSNTLLTANRTYSLPNADGNLALTSDLYNYYTISQINLLSESLAQGQAYTDNFRSRVLTDLGTYLPTKTAHDVAKLKQEDLWNKASLVITPAGINTSKLYSIKPRDASGDMTVVRDTTATVVNEDGLIESVALNVPRIDYTNSTCPSVLIEPQRTNLLTYSEDFSNVAYSKLNATVSTNTSISPDGTSNADSFTENTNNSSHGFLRTITQTTSGSFTISYFVKANGRTKFEISEGFSIGGNIQFDLVSKTATTSSPALNGFIKEYNNGWFRVGGTWNLTANANTIIYFTLKDNTGNFTYTGDGTSGLYVYGTQLEQGSYPTSYIPTVASAVTRNADLISQKTITPTIGGAVINSGFVQNYTTSTPSIVDLRSNFDTFATLSSQLTDSQITALGKQKAVFLTDIKAEGAFSITVSGIGTIYWGDGTTRTYNGSNIVVNKTFVKAGGIVAFVGTLTYFLSDTNNSNASHRIESLPSGLTYYLNRGPNTTSGSISNLPSGLVTYDNRGSNTTSGSISSLPSGLTYYYNGGSNTTSGSISSLPSGVTYYLNAGKNQVNQYTSGRVWANNMERLYHAPASGFGLTSTMVDSLLIDLANVTTWVGSKQIFLAANNAPRTSASDVAVATLQANGVTVTTN